MNPALRAVAVAMLVGTIVAPARADATITPIPRSARPLPQRQVRAVPVNPANSWQAVHTGPHTMYGTITAMQGDVITVQMRNGRVQKVNVAAAVAHGDYSAPLFIGKLVSVDGIFQAGTFTAAHVFRLNNLSQLPNDH